MEILDICNEEGVPKGKTVERKIAHRDGILHRTAHVWIIRRKDEKFEVLLQRRSMKKDSFPGLLDTSSAGHIPAGDEPRISAIRELEEELGICEKPEALRFIGTFRVQYEEEFHGSMFKDNEVAHVYVYERDLSPEEITVQEEELDGVLWYDFEETVKAVAEDHPDFCVPPKGLAVLKKYIDGLRCPCCGRHYYSEKNAYEICPVCGWEDDPVQRADESFAGGANEKSLREAKKVLSEAKKVLSGEEKVIRNDLHGMK